MKPAPFSVWIRPGQSLPSAYELGQERANAKRSTSLMLLGMALLLALALALALAAH